MSRNDARVIFWAVGAVGATLVVAPAAPIFLPLDSALARVERTHPELRMHALRAEAKDAMAKGARALMPPEISFGVVEMPYGPLRMNESPDAAAMFSLRQMFPGPGKRGAKSDFLSSQSALDREEGEAARRRLFAETKIWYVRRAMAEKKLAVLAMNEDVMRSMVELAEARFRYRQGDLSAYFQAKAERGELRNMRSMLEGMAREAEVGLKALMSDSSPEPLAVDTALRLRGFQDFPLDSARRQAQPEIRKMDHALEAMRRNLFLARVQGRPDFGLEFGHMEMFGMDRKYSMMAMMTLPKSPLSASMFKSEIRAMEREIEAMRRERESMLLMKDRMLREMQSMLRSEVEQAERYRLDILADYRKNLESLLAGYRDNTQDLFRVLAARDKLLMAELSGLDHLEKALLLEVEYERQTGL